MPALLDPAEGVHCYCPESSSDSALLRGAKRNPGGTIGFSKPWGKEMSHLKCATGAALPIPSDATLLIRGLTGNATHQAPSAAGPRVAAAGTPTHARGHASGAASQASSGESAVWPRGCGDAYSEHVVDDPQRCLPERFFFSYVEGELPVAGHDLLHLHDVLNRTVPGALVSAVWT